MNSREVVSFLELNSFCPDLLTMYPQLLYEHRDKPNHAVAHCVFIPRHNLFLTISNCKKNNRSVIKMYNFKTSTAVEDSFLLKSKHESKKQRLVQNALRASSGGRSSYTVIKSFQPECDPDSMVRKPMTDKCEVECLFEYHFHHSMIHTCDYHKDQDVLCIGTGRGYIIMYDIRVEPDSVRLDFKAKQKVKFKNNGPEKVVDRDTTQQNS